MATKLPVEYAHWDDMVFEGREKSYGAYKLRQRYPRHLIIGLITVGLLGGTLAAFPKWRHLFFSSPAQIIQERIIEVTLESLALDKPEEEKLELPKLPPPEPPKLRMLEYRIPTPSDEGDLDDDQTIHRIDSLQNAPNLGLTNQEGENQESNWMDPFETGEGIPDVVREQGIPDAGDFVFVDEEPLPLNMDEITRVIEYPQVAREAGIEGTVVVRVLVGKDGHYVQHKVINSVHPLLDREIEKHLSKLKFTPAIQGRKPILFWVNIPFKFHTLR